MVTNKNINFMGVNQPEAAAFGSMGSASKRR